MGYDISVTVKNSDKVFKFLQREFRAPAELHESLMPKEYVYMFHGGENGSYAPKHKNLIGFLYSTFDLVSGEYMYTILRWLAMKFGTTTKFGDERFNFYYYDSERNPVVLKSEKYPERFLHKENNWKVCDEFGYSGSLIDGMIKSKIEFRMVAGMSKKKATSLIRDEIKRLDEAWENQK